MKASEARHISVMNTKEIPSRIFQLIEENAKDGLSRLYALNDSLYSVSHCISELEALGYTVTRISATIIEISW